MSLFNRPTWATSTVSKPDDAEVDIFRHSTRSYREIAAEQARERQEKKTKEEKKKQARREQETANNARRKDNDNQESSLKRRRITFEDGEALLNRIGIESPVVGKRETAVVAPQVVLEDDDHDELYVDVDDNYVVESTRPVRASPRRANNAGIIPSPKTQYVQPATKQDRNSARTEPAKPAPVAIIDDESDDELAELSRRARQQHLQQKTEAAAASHSPESSSGPKQVFSTGANIAEVPDPVIELLISSPLPNTKPLIVHRKLSQRLQEIREAWCNRQAFSKEFSDGVFFIHRMHRVYDVTTCKSLGLDVDVFGNLTLKGAGGKEGVDKVHLEAVTEEIYQRMRQTRDRKVQQRSGQFHAETDAGHIGPADETEALASKPEELVRLLLKAKGREDFKLRVKPSATFARIMAAYCKAVAPGSSIYLQFDGDRLDPNDDVQGSELSDMDCVDVYFVE